MRGRRAQNALRQSLATVGSAASRNNSDAPGARRRPLSASSTQRPPLPATTLATAAVARAGDVAARAFAQDAEAQQRPSSAFLWRDLVRHASNDNGDGGAGATAEAARLAPPVAAADSRRPSTGLRCYGDFCHFDRVARLLVDGASPAAAVAARGDRSRDCPHRLALKSVILARTETRFVGQPLDGAVESLVVRARLQPLDDDALRMYFVRRHVNRIAQRCQEEARVLLFGHAGRAAALLTPDDTRLSGLYRRLVYGAALAQIHPSRFYYAVQLCACCYRTYSFLDAQRDAVILHSVAEAVAAAHDAQQPRHLFGGASVAYRKEDADWRAAADGAAIRPRARSTGDGGGGGSLPRAGFRRPRSATSLQLQRASDAAASRDGGAGRAPPDDSDEDDDVFADAADVRAVRQLQRRAMQTAQAPAVERVDSADYYRYQHSSFAAAQQQQPPPQPQQAPQRPQSAQGRLQQRSADGGQLAQQIADGASAFGLRDRLGSDAAASPAGGSAASSSLLRGTATQPGVAETRRIVAQINSQQQALLADSRRLDYQRLYVQHAQLAAQTKPAAPRPQAASVAGDSGDALPATRPQRRASATGGSVTRSSLSGGLVVTDAIAAALRALDAQDVALPDEAARVARMMRPEREQRAPPPAAPGRGAARRSRSSLSQLDNDDDDDAGGSGAELSRASSGVVPDAVAAAPQAAAPLEPASLPPSLVASRSAANTPRSDAPPDADARDAPRAVGAKAKSSGDLRVLALQNTAAAQPRPPPGRPAAREAPATVAREAPSAPPAEGWQAARQQFFFQPVPIDAAAPAAAAAPSQPARPASAPKKQRAASASAALPSPSRTPPPGGAAASAAAVAESQRPTVQRPQRGAAVAGGVSPSPVRRASASAAEAASPIAAPAGDAGGAGGGSRIRAAQQAQLAQEAKLRQLEAQPLSAEAEAYADQLARRYAAELRQDIESLYATLDADGVGDGAKKRRRSGATASGDAKAAAAAPPSSSSSYAFALDSLPFGDAPLLSLNGDAVALPRDAVASRAPGGAAAELSAVLEDEGEDDDTAHPSPPAQRPQPPPATRPAPPAALRRGDSGQSVSSQLSSAPTVVVHPLSPRQLRDEAASNATSLTASSPARDGRGGGGGAMLIDVPQERDVDPLSEDDDAAQMFLLSSSPTGALSAFATHDAAAGGAPLSSPFALSP